MNKISLWELFLTFMKIGAVALGGGYVILPILKDELVDKKNLISKEDLMNYFALSQSMPGIIAANISMFTGYKIRGRLGAIAAMLGVVFIPFLTIVIIAEILSNFTSNIYMQGIFWGIGVAVTALILLTSKELWQNSRRNLFFYIIFLLSLICLLVLKIDPVKVILGFTIVGIIYKRIEYVRSKNDLS